MNINRKKNGGVAIVLFFMLTMLCSQLSYAEDYKFKSGGAMRSFYKNDDTVAKTIMTAIGISKKTGRKNYEIYLLIKNNEQNGEEIQLLEDESEYVFELIDDSKNIKHRFVIQDIVSEYPEGILSEKNVRLL